jgi:starch synthase (maltosyl-transferring)
MIPDQEDPPMDPRRPDPADRILIEDVRPSVDGGRFPAKRLAGEPCVVEAVAFRDGHDVIRAVLLWRPRGESRPREVEMQPVNPGLDLWRASFLPSEPGRYAFTVAAWTDRYATWLADFRKRVRGRQPRLAPDAAEGAALLAASAARGAHAGVLRAAVDALGAADADPARALAAAEAAEGPMKALQERSDLCVFRPELEIVADRRRAVFGSWYELFVRSQGRIPGRGSTFREAEARLPDLQAMGFDVVYLAPIHPIGKTNRKGRNNALVAGPGDPGSPWGIGSEAGGHDAVEPSLGTLEDFDRFVAACGRHGLEVALDFALQCSPDHPWVREHPAWFRRRPDGSIRFAENPPKKYEDIYPIDFDTPDRDGLWREIRRILLFWAARGVRIFRVDNPHTKPLPFWRWLIEEVQAAHPDVLFLAEAFTRPPMMRALGKAGFTQSYTYFTWRHTKAELAAYLTELAALQDSFRPNFFPSTPDILPGILVHGGRPAFTLRLLLAATLSPSYGIYSGYELGENAALPHHAVPGEYEYADSEKYELRVRDWNAPGNFKDFIARINRLRRENPALQSLSGLRFLESSDDQILAYARVSADGANRLLVAANLDPSRPREGVVRVPADVSGLPAGSRYEVRDLLSGAVWEWSDANYVRLDPAVEPGHVLRIERRLA